MEESQHKRKPSILRSIKKDGVRDVTQLICSVYGEGSWWTIPEVEDLPWGLAYRWLKSLYVHNEAPSLNIEL